MSEIKKIANPAWVYDDIQFVISENYISWMCFKCGGVGSLQIQNSISYFIENVRYHVGDGCQR